MQLHKRALSNQAGASIDISSAPKGLVKIDDMLHVDARLAYLAAAGLAEISLGLRSAIIVGNWL